MEDLGDPPTTAYWLAWATAFLLIIAVVSAGVMNFTDDGPEGGLVSAAGRTPGTIDVASTTTTAPDAPAQATSTTTRRPTTPTSTTIPSAAAAVLKAIGSTAPPASTTTTSPPVTSTSPTTATTTSTTSTTLPARATVTVVNQSDRAFEITVNGRAFTLGPAPASAPQTAQIDLPNATDTIRGSAVGEPTCQVGGTGDLFRPGGAYEVAIVTGGTCAELRVKST